MSGQHLGHREDVPLEAVDEVSLRRPELLPGDEQSLPRLGQVSEEGVGTRLHPNLGGGMEVTAVG